MELRVEQMSPIFTKHHVEGLRVPVVFHTFTAPDEGDPHDHPFDFTTTIISGGCVERVYEISQNGHWAWTERTRGPGSFHRVEATAIHRIVRLLDGPCETMILPGPKTREPHFWRIEDGRAVSRPWWER